MWNEEKLEMLKALWREGLSTSQIATRLGDGFTRNAVIGKANRIGLAGRPRQEAQNRRATKAEITLPKVKMAHSR